MVALRIWELVAYTIAPFVGVLGVMIFVHELGHYLAARALGIRVLIFKLGFGNFIFKFTRGPTEYGVAWFPIGGYVKLFGDPTEVEGGEEEIPLEEIPEIDKKEALFYRPAHHKILVFVAGAAMNILLAFAIAPLVYLIGIEEQKMPAAIGSVTAGSPAEQAGLKAGDTIVSIAGKPTTGFKDVVMAEALNPRNTVEYNVLRNGQALTITVTLGEDPKEGIGQSGIMPPPLSARVGGLVEDSPAARAGLQLGDTILMVNNAGLRSWDDLQKAINQAGDRESALVVSRAGARIELKIKPEFNPDFNRYLIGISPYVETEFVRYGLGRAASEGAKDALNYIVLTFEILWKLISGQLSAKTMSGPLGIGAITSQAAHSGLAAVIGLMVLISVNLGILNLLPFPPLDGGHILVSAIEGVLGREIKMKYKEAAFRVGFFLLIGLMILVTIKDFWRYKGAMGGFFVDIWKGLGL